MRFLHFGVWHYFLVTHSPMTSYSSTTRLGIPFAVSVVSQFLNALCDSHWHAVMCILQYQECTGSQTILWGQRQFQNSVTLMLIGQDHHQIEDLPLAIVFLLEVTWFHGEARSKIQLLDPVLKLDTVPWLQLQVKLHGYDNFSCNNNLETPRTLSLFVIIKLLFTFIQSSLPWMD